MAARDRTDPADIVIDETLSLLEEWRFAAEDEAPPRDPLPSLFKQCQEAVAALDASPGEPVRTLHHFACTGGTLISRCVEAQPNTVLLSEIDPFSPLPRRKVDFAPYDILKQAQTGLRPLTDAGVEATFLAGLSAMHEALRLEGRRLVLRDHSHSHFCTGVDPDSRPLIRAVLEKRFDVISLVTVRHPIDSFLSLRKNKWVMYEPDTLEEYCRRYLLFLDAYAEAPLLRYEDFVADPEAGARSICERLALPYSPTWRDHLPVITVSGDSGRKSDEIAPRERRPVSEEIAAEADESASYAALCERLGYQRNVEAPACRLEPDTPAS